MAKSVFISYSSRDRMYVDKLKKMLDKMDISYWVAPEMIPAGSSYAREIPVAIQGCDIFLLVLTKESQKSIWVEKELDSAINARKVIVPFQMEEMVYTDIFRFYLNNVQTILAYQNPKEGIQRLKDVLVKILAGGDNSNYKIPGNSSVTGQGEQVRRNLYNTLNYNQIPIYCEECQGDLTQISLGIYKCRKCGKDNYDSFQKVRNYLRRRGAASAVEIERDTGVPRKTVEHFLKEEYLEIPAGSSARLSCVRCGAPIRTGTLCGNCKR